MSMADRIRSKLKEAFGPVSIEVQDESHLHAGHAGARPGGESHFRVTIVAAAFDGMSRVDRHRRVYSVLSDEMAGPVHALALTNRTPEEQG